MGAETDDDVANIARGWMTHTIGIYHDRMAAGRSVFCATFLSPCMGLCFTTETNPRGRMRDEVRRSVLIYCKPGTDVFTTSAAVREMLKVVERRPTKRRKSITRRMMKYVAMRWNWI